MLAIVVRSHKHAEAHRHCKLLAVKNSPPAKAATAEAGCLGKARTCLDLKIFTFNKLAPGTAVIVK